MVRPEAAALCRRQEPLRDPCGGQDVEVFGHGVMVPRLRQCADARIWPERADSELRADLVLQRL